MKVGKLKHDDFLKIDIDYKKAAEIANLVYVSDSGPGINRQRKGKGFSYTFKDKLVKQPHVLERIQSLVIPPAWENVWICPLPNGHIQVTGFDVRKRKQYRYHPKWNELRDKTKFHRLYEFGLVLPAVRNCLQDHLASNELSAQKVMALVISLMERTYIRIGNISYEKMNGSFGLTTLKDKHVQANGSDIHFSFTGKKGIEHRITLKSKRLAKLVKQCRDIPGKELFQYYDADGLHHSIDSGMVNQYIKEISGQEFTAKDFRTWAGSLNMLRALKSVDEAIDETIRKKNIVAALDIVSKQLGNTRSVCKKYYVHPSLISLYEENNLAGYLKELDNVEEPDTSTGYTTAEKVLLKILQKEIANP